MIDPPGKIRWRLSRRPANPEMYRAWRRHAHQVGEIASAWNDLQACLFSLFETLSATHSLGVTHAIWHSFQSDSAQRTMLLAVARAALFEERPQLERIEWLIGKVNDLAASRNDPIHTPMDILQDEAGKAFVDPSIFMAREQAVRRLQQKPLEKSWRRIRGDLHVLSVFATALNLWIRNQHYATLPRRPRLLSVPVSPNRRNQRHRARGKPPLPPPP